MTAASIRNEEGFVFDCDGDQLIGIIHHVAASTTEWGVLTIVAGGPQYRGGCGRQLVALGRHLADQGFPVMRFDHRGLGDSEGMFRGFEYLEDDITAALAEFRRRVPGLRHIVLWGGCDAASAAIMSAPHHPEVAGIVAANPWVTTEATAAKVRQKHYLNRIRQASFWKKLFTFQYNPANYLRIFAMRKNSRKNVVVSHAQHNQKSYVERMRDSLAAFEGQTLLLMSGRSLISREFDELVAGDSSWKAICQSPRVIREEITDADQTFSSASARAAMLHAAANWMKRLSAASPHSGEL